MAQKQLNDPPPVLEGSSFSDQTSQLDLRSDEQPSVSITPDSMGPSVSPSPGLESSQSISLSPPRASGSFCDKIIIIAFSIVNLRPISLPLSFGM